ncbi:glycine/betaine ABC transporter [Frondihabitans sp. PAMC 28766]|uniref:ABC transporter substrate-binding protein n=1 Tax=Frondihabitans sp. PAMC 28766 TaxID=1795630 RepID=UPI00078CC26D|nr:ABC transporter substrate-binding protein [Frondihabitans sp. PAMC 28766]AMM21098.1 glycine/betaine ABC transporter [Frondihabitans sp. PAMC 28766]
MITAKKGRLALIGAVAIGAVVALAGCSSSSPLSSGSGGGGKIVVGYQAYYSDQIVAEAYAQALTNAGFSASTKSSGQRSAYLPALKAGGINVIPDYSGGALQFYEPSATALSESQIETELKSKLPSNLRILTAAAATDQDTYSVTKAFSEKYGITSIGDLSKYPGTVTVGANAEFATRPYGIPGLKSVYGVTGTVKAIADSGGANTVAALKSGQVQVADIYTSSPAIKANDFVVLKDPKNMILPQNIIPIVDKNVNSKAAAVINKVQAKLTQDELVKLNDESVTTKEQPATTAKKFLKSSGIVK